MATTKQKIYFIPGTMCDERLWTKVWQTLTPLLANNVEFTHLSIPSLETISDITDYIAAQLNENSSLVGFSLGGYFASEIAIKYPQKVSNLLLVSNMSSALPEKENKERARTIQFIKKNGYTGIPNKRINHLLDPSSHHNEHIKETIRAMDKTMGVNVLLHQLNVTTLRANLLPQLIKLVCPLKFCIGDTDCLVKIERIENQLSQSISNNKTLEVIPNTGHMLPLEQPEVLAHVIAKWFTANE
jgi:pimeloyl-ACP methyl ester carboxylesterase